MTSAESSPANQMMKTTARTLTASGFLIDDPIRKPTYMLFRCHRYDEFGVSSPYLIVLCEPGVGLADVKAINQVRCRDHASTILVTDGDPVALAASVDAVAPGTMKALAWSAFLEGLGGPVRSWLPLEPDFKNTLDQLGHNLKIPGIDGRPDTLFEEYVHSGLQFLLDDRVIRYGQARSGDPVPEGLAFTRGNPLLYYDAKAATKGYKVNIDSIRQFSDYVNSFRRRYESLVQPLRTFLVVSGDFDNSPSSLEKFSSDMVAESGIPLCYMRAKDLGGAAAYFAKHPTLRHAVDWRSVFTNRFVKLSTVKAAANKVRRDAIIRTSTLPERGRG